MSKNMLLGLCLALLAGRAAAAESAAQALPAQAIAALEIFQPRAVLGPLLEKETRATLALAPALQRATAKPEFQQFQVLVQFLETQLGADWPTALQKLTGGGVALGLYPQQRTVFVAEAEDETMLRQLHTLLWNCAQNQAALAGKPSPATSRQLGNATAYSLGKNEAHVIAGRRLLWAKNLETLESALQSTAQGGNLAAAADYQAARRAVGPGAAGMLYLNMRALKLAPGIAKALQPGGGNPLGALLFAGLGETAGAANWIAIGLHVKPHGLALQLSSDAAPAGTNSPAAFALPATPAAGALPNLTVPRQIAALSLYRDLHRFYAAKDQLFPERTSGLIFFENMMGIFFSGRDLTDDVLAQAQPHLRFVAAQQQFDPAGGTPVYQLPAFAVVLQLRHPEQFRETMEEAWQKAVGMASFTRGQRAEPGFIIDRPVHNGIPFSVARFSTGYAKDLTKLDVRYNFRPALAMPGNYLILSSTDGLARDLMDALAHEGQQPVAPRAQLHGVLELEGGKVAAALRANRGFMVKQNMLKGGEAKDNGAQIDGLIGLADFIRSARLTTGPQQAQLDLDFNWPPAAPRVAQTP
jgi:hypothetical protein